MKKLHGQIAILATLIGTTTALVGVEVDSLGGIMAIGFALIVMGWIQDDIHHREHTSH